MKKQRRFKFLRSGLKSEFNGFQWTIGIWHKTKCLELCHGFNCSEKILDALSYVKGEILAEVEAEGKHFTGDGKSTWEKMRIIRAWHWSKKDSVCLSIFSAELVLKNYESIFPNDDRPRKAIEAAKNYLKCPAESAARSAARFAAESAESAAWFAAESAAWFAAESAESAKSAWSAVLDKIQVFLVAHLESMEEWRP
jgi:hypothetical protein